MKCLAAIAVCTLSLLLLNSVFANASDEVVITCVNQTDRFVKFEIWNRRPKFWQSSVITAPRHNDSALPWVMPGSTDLDKYKVKAYVWNENIDQWIGKSKWLNFRESDGHVGVEFVKTNNGTSYLLREIVPPTED